MKDLLVLFHTMREGLPSSPEAICRTHHGLPPSGDNSAVRHHHVNQEEPVFPFLLRMLQIKYFLRHYFTMRLRRWKILCLVDIHIRHVQYIYSHKWADIYGSDLDNNSEWSSFLSTDGLLPEQHAFSSYIIFEGLPFVVWGLSYPVLNFSGLILFPFLIIEYIF